MNILIVDDDGDDRDLFCEILKEIIPAANCIVAEDGESALKYLRTATVVPDYIFLDVYMNGMNGNDCLLAIKCMEAIQNVPVIMYSGLDNANHVQLYKNLGASEFICKPTTIEALREILLSIMKKFPGRTSTQQQS